MKYIQHIIVLSLFLTACGGTVYSPAGMELKEISLLSSSEERIEIVVEIADDDSERAQDLMLRTELQTGHGMLFVFPDAQQRAFWMKDTLIPLDILFFDADGAFVSATTMQPCSENTCKTYASAAPAKYVLEVPAGFLQEHEAGERWQIQR